MKATFQLTLLVEEEEVVLFNTQLANGTYINPMSGLRVWAFEPTPIMSSYLVAWAIGEPFFCTCASVLLCYPRCL